MRSRRGIAALALLLILAAPAWAASGGDYAECELSFDPDGAIAACTRFLQHPNESAGNRAVAHYNRGTAYSEKREYSRALADIDEAIRLDPKYASAYNNRCWVRAVIGQLPAALADCTQSLRLRPNHANALDNRGLVYLKLGELDRAIADYDAALRLDPRLVESLYGRGLARIRKGDAAGQADIQAAEAIEANIAEQFAKYGVK